LGVGGGVPRKCSVYWCVAIQPVSLFHPSPITSFFPNVLPPASSWCTQRNELWNLHGFRSNTSGTAAVVICTAVTQSSRRLARAWPIAARPTALATQHIPAQLLATWAIARATPSLPDARMTTDTMRTTRSGYTTRVRACSTCMHVSCSEHANVPAGPRVSRWPRALPAQAHACCN
jgi:hypothetical protein